LIKKGEKMNKLTQYGMSILAAGAVVLSSGCKEDAQQPEAAPQSLASQPEAAPQSAPVSASTVKQSQLDAVSMETRVDFMDALRAANLAPGKETGNKGCKLAGCDGPETKAHVERVEEREQECIKNGYSKEDRRHISIKEAAEIHKNKFIYVNPEHRQRVKEQQAQQGK